jgi:hypothetical protein
MEFTTRGLWTMLHGMGFGALYLLAFSGAAVELFRIKSGDTFQADSDNSRFLTGYLAGMAVLAWLAVLSGAYIVYPWYRAVAPVGAASLAAFPQMLLKSSPATAHWHSLGMEWKEYVAWLVPISSTMAAAVAWRYGKSLRIFSQLRAAVLSFVVISFVAASLAGFFGAMLNKHAPVEGGRTIHVLTGDAR